MIDANYNNGEPVVPSDTVSPTGHDYHALYVGGLGNVSYLDKGGHVVTLTAVPVGTFLRGIGIKRVNASLTTATLMVGFW